jgi:hypothetical protein
MAWEITPRRPFPELQRMRKEMDRLWESFFERPESRLEEEGEWSRSLDVSETKNDIIFPIFIHLGGSNSD